MPALVSLLPADSLTVHLIRPFRSFLERVRYYAFEQEESEDESEFIDQRSYENWLVHFRESGAPGTSVLLRLLHLILTDDPRYQEIQGILGQDGLGLVDSISLRHLGPPVLSPPGEQSAHVYWLTFQPSMQTSPNARGFAFSSLSSGTQRVIRILVSLIFDQSSLMLLEHPEDGIHQGLLRKLIGLLTSYADQSQLIVSSHSPIVFNSLDAASVRLVTMEEGSTHVRALTGKELGVAGRFLEEEGSLSDFLETVEED